MRNPISMLAIGLVLVLGLWIDAARADIIRLTNGRSLKGRITAHSGGRTTVQLDNGGRLIMPSDEIDSVEPDEEKPAPRVPTGTKPEEPAAPVGTTGKPAPADQGTKEPAPPGTTPAGEKPVEAGSKGKELDLAEIQRQAVELAPRIKELIEQFGTEGAPNEDQRVAARAELVKMGEPAVGLLAEALRDPSPLRQEQAATVISAIGSKRAAKPLLAALNAATPKTGKETKGGILVLNAMAAAFNRVTGQNFPYDAADIDGAQAVIAQMLVWWQDNVEKFPAQIGDPPKEPKAEEAKPAEEAPDKEKDAEPAKAPQAEEQ